MIFPLTGGYSEGQVRSDFSFKTSSWYQTGSFPNVTTSGQHYNIGEKPSVILLRALTLASMLLLLLFLFVFVFILLFIY